MTKTGHHKPAGQAQNPIFEPHRLSEPNGGEEFAYALLAASCAAEVTTEHVYLALITPSGELDEDREAPSS
jgi:hypothetical protein